MLTEINTDRTKLFGELILVTDADLGFAEIILTSQIQIFTFMELILR